MPEASSKRDTVVTINDLEDEISCKAPAASLKNCETSCQSMRLESEENFRYINKVKITGTQISIFDFFFCLN